MQSNDNDATTPGVDLGRCWKHCQTHLLDLLKILALPESERETYMTGLPEPLEILWGNAEIAIHWALVELPAVSRDAGEPGAFEAECRLLLIHRELWEIWDESKSLARETRCAALGSPFPPSDQRWPAIRRAAQAALLELGVSGPLPPARDWLHLLPVVIPEDYHSPEEPPEDRLRAESITASMLAGRCA